MLSTYFAILSSLFTLHWFKNDGVQYYTNSSVSSKKLFLVIPFSGNVSLDNIEDQRGAATFQSYPEICEKTRKYFGEGTVKKFDSVAKTSYFRSGKHWVQYDDEESIEWKMKFVRDKGLGGASVWNLDDDDFQGSCGNNTKYPLFRTVVNSLINGSFKYIGGESITDYCPIVNTLDETPSVNNESSDTVNVFLKSVNNTGLFALVGIAWLVLSICTVIICARIRIKGSGHLDANNNAPPEIDSTNYLLKCNSRTGTDPQESHSLMRYVAISEAPNLTDTDKLTFHNIMKFWEIPEELIVFGHEIGSGSFGTVFKGLYNGITAVALKKLHIRQEDSQLPEKLKLFRKEVAFLR